MSSVIKKELIRLADRLDLKKKYSLATKVDELLKDTSEDEDELPGLENDPDEFSDYDDINVSDYEKDTPSKMKNTSPENTLLDRLLLSKMLKDAYSDMSPEEIALKLNIEDPEVITLLEELKSPFYN